MLDKEIRQTIISLHNKWISNRKISKILKTSRNTIKKILQDGVDIPQPMADDENTQLIPILREIFERCRGNAVRVHGEWSKICVNTL